MIFSNLFNLTPYFPLEPFQQLLAKQYLGLQSWLLEEISEKEGCFRKLSCLEKRKNTSSLRDTLLGRDILVSNSTSYNEGSLAHL